MSEKKDGRTDGWMEGRKEGRKGGRKEGRKGGRKEGTLNAKIQRFGRVVRLQTRCSCLLGVDVSRRVVALLPVRFALFRLLQGPWVVLFAINSTNYILTNSMQPRFENCCSCNRCERDNGSIILCVIHRR